MVVKKLLCLGATVLCLLVGTVAHAQELTIESAFSSAVNLVIKRSQDKASYDAVKDANRRGYYFYIVGKNKISTSRSKYTIRSVRVNRDRTVTTWAGDYQIILRDSGGVRRIIPELVRVVRENYGRGVGTNIALPYADGRVKFWLIRHPTKTPEFKFISLILPSVSVILEQGDKTLGIYRGTDLIGREYVENSTILFLSQEIDDSLESKGIKVGVFNFLPLVGLAGIGLVHEDSSIEWFPMHDAYRSLRDAAGNPIVGRGLNQADYGKYQAEVFAIAYTEFQIYHAIIMNIIGNMAL